MPSFSRQETLFLVILAAALALSIGTSRLYYHDPDFPGWERILLSGWDSREVAPHLKREGEGINKAKADSISGPVDLNRATLEDLMRLPGIGPVLAQRILTIRSDRGRFTDPQELLEVEGLGPKRYEKIKGLVEVR
ncbi:MAG: helix-hairpin-helix domain-containing protein [candidate division NC10 bacterium]|nr:helix-hairpin-helix domain-containing protein [candidate division NC10 bacterium]